MATSTIHVALVLASRTSGREGGEVDVVHDVYDVLTDAGMRCSQVLVESPESVAGLIASNLLAFPFSRWFRSNNGANGSIVELLEDRAIAFLGSNAEGHAAKSKIHMKAVLENHGLPTPRWRLVTEHTAVNAVSGLRFPLIVKPDEGGNSVGVVRIDDLAALRQLRLRYGPTIAEEWMRVREFTVAVIGNGFQRRGFPVEIIVSAEDQFLTAEVKQRKQRATWAPVVDAVMNKRLADLAAAAAMALRITDWCRVDILEDAERDLYVIDVNTLPGLSRRKEHPSSFPICLQYAYGAGFAETILALVAVGLLRHGMVLPAAAEAAHAKMLT